MLFTVVPMLVAALGHWVLYRWAVACWPRVARHKWIFVAIVTLLVVASPLLRWFFTRKHVAFAGTIHSIVSIELLAVVLAAVPLALLRGVFRATAPKPASDPSPAPEPSRSPPQLSRRQIVEAATGSSFLAASGSMFGWGILRGRHAFQVDELVVKIPGLSRVLDGYTIAQVSDIHVGAYIGDRELAEGFARIAEIRPDIVVATGDLVDFDRTYGPLIARRLADLQTRDGVFAILGNHDHYAGADPIVGALRAAGVDALVNAGRHIRAADGGGFALLGLDDLLGARRGAGPILARADAMVPADAPRIVLSHQPSTIDLWAGRVALQLSGHTHGGQINPGFRPADLLMRYVAGRYEVPAPQATEPRPLRGTTLYVNRGFGTVGPPARIGAPPEVTKVVLVAG